MVERPSPIAAGLTLYRPEWAIFEKLLGRVRTEADAVFVVVDGPVGEAIEKWQLDRLEMLDDVAVLPLRPNAGIACGLNRLVEAARDAGVSRIIFFDQDSEAGEGLVETLNNAFTSLQVGGHRPAAIGPRPVAAVGSQTRAPLYRRHRQRVGEFVMVDFVIVSGCVLDLEGSAAIGLFDETLGMDGVDVEWGFRARSKGFSVFVHDGVRLAHRVGTGIVRMGPVAFPRQNRARMESYVRSQSRMLRMRHVPLRWKLRSVLYVPLQCLAYSLESKKPLRTFTRLLGAAVGSSNEMTSENTKP